MRAEFIDPKTEAGRPSPQIRGAHPFAPEAPHPRALEMAEALRELRGTNGSAQPGDLRGAGFTTAEIVEFGEAAVKIADGVWEKHLSAGPDLLQDMRLKVREAVPDHPPQPKGARAGQAFHHAWWAYCRARLAEKVDPCDEMREYCLRRLSTFLAETPLGPGQTAHLRETVSDLLYGRVRGVRQ